MTNTRRLSPAVADALAATLAEWVALFNRATGERRKAMARIVDISRKLGRQTPTPGGDGYIKGDGDG